MDNGSQKSSDILRENSSGGKINILDFIKYKVEREFKVSVEFNENYSSKMDKSIQSFKKDISTLRTGRANNSMLDTIKLMFMVSLCLLSN